MSSESIPDDSAESFEKRLESMYERYRRRDLEDRLEELAETMEATILQQTLAEAFFDASIDLDHDTKIAVERSMETLDQEQYETIEDDLPSLRKAVEDEQTRVSNEIQKHRLDRLDTVRAMRRLNERVERVDSMRLEALEGLLDDWNWRIHVYTDTAETLPERRKEASNYGEEMAIVFAQLKESLFNPYKGTDLWPLVQTLLDEERLTYGDLDTHERQLLAESDLDEYIELSLS